MNKCKLLWMGEATFLNTGYGVYGRELLTRLHQTGKYEIAELGGYGRCNDARSLDIPWTYYGCMPDDESQNAEYAKNIANQWGLWRFEEICLDFRPDVVLDIRDWWMTDFVGRSPFRRLFSWILMPTIDSAPQMEQWLDTYLSADAVLTYSEFGRDTLLQETNGQVKFQGVASAAADYTLFKPVADKAAHKAHMGLDEDTLIVGTVMRNQKRKLYPDLILGFRSYLEQYPRIADRSFLYMHTAYPDIGWDLPRLIRESGIGHKILCTYICTGCRHVFPSFFQDARRTCPKCGGPNAKMPSGTLGATTKDLADIMNTFDVYVQYSTCLHKDEEVLTYSGWKPIGVIQKGDLVYTHEHNWRPVTNIHKNHNNNNMKKICMWGDYQTLRITDNHPIYSYKHDDVCRAPADSCKNTREILGDRLRHKHVIPAPAFNAVHELRKNDLLVYPIDDKVSWVNQRDITPWKSVRDTVLDNGQIKIKHGHIYPSRILIDEQFCKFIGLFAADGSASSSGCIKVTCHKDESDNIGLAQDVMRTIGGKLTTQRIYKQRLAIDIMLNSRIHYRAFKEWFYNNDKSKKLPDWCMTLPTQLQEKIISGLCMGDGHYSSSHNVSIFVTTSYVLAEQLKTLCRRCRIYYNTRIRHKSGNRQPQYRFEISGDIANEDFTKAKKRLNTGSLYLNNYQLIKIKSIDDIQCDDKYVYDLEVSKDHSYTTHTCVIHNCEGLGIPQIEAAACGVPVMAVDYSAMSSVVRNLGGTPIKVQRLFREAETHAYRAYPDNEDFAHKLGQILSKSSTVRKKMARDTYLACRKHYDWERATKTWMKALDDVVPSDWSVTPRITEPNLNIPNGLSDQDFVNWCIANIWGEPDKVNSYVALRMARDLHYGEAISGYGGVYYSEDSLLVDKPKYRTFNRRDVVDAMLEMNATRNYWERRRAGILDADVPAYIQLARHRREINV